MYKKLVSSILVVAVLNLLGCYSFKSVTVPEYKQVEEKEDKPDEIYVITKDDQEYHFADSNFYFENDTLYGTEILVIDTLYGKETVKIAREYQFNRKIALTWVGYHRKIKLTQLFTIILVVKGWVSGS